LSSSSKPESRAKEGIGTAVEDFCALGVSGGEGGFIKEVVDDEVVLGFLRKREGGGMALRSCSALGVRTAGVGIIDVDVSMRTGSSV
jgi:hypothetical protein